MTMPDPLHESLTKLDGKYQILTELHHCGESRTYLGRDLELNRDVTITVAHAPRDKAFLNAYAADAGVLQTKRHPNIVPVLEGTWLDDATFAVVRARVRGSTLDQTVNAGGAMPEATIAVALDELTNALIWARDNGITSRCIEPETFVFQQGTGRVLIGFEPSQLIAGDAETIEALARRMNGNTPMDVRAYTARLGAPPVTKPRSAARAAAVATTAATAEEMAVQSTKTDRQVSVPVGSDAVAVVERPNRGMSFMARVLTTFGVIAAVAVGGVLFMQHRRGEAQAQAAAQASEQESAGDVSPAAALDTAAAYSSITPSVPAPPPPNIDSIGRENEKRIAEAKALAAQSQAAYGSPYGTYPSSSGSSLYPPAPTSSYPSSSYPSSPYPSSTSASTSPRPTTTVTTSTSTPASVTASVPAPAPVEPTRPAVDSLGRPELLDPCGSPIGSDQAQCMATAIDKADRTVNGTFQRLIEALRRQAGVAASDPDPASVEELRSSQKSWLQDRESSCKAAGAGSSFYARERGTCYTERSIARKEELQRQLDAVP